MGKPRTSVSEGTGKFLSVSRTWEIIDRWVQNKIAVYGHVYTEQSGGGRWIHLTRKGLREAGLTFPSQAPSLSTLKHLYWTNQVRMHFEDIYDASQMHWISERSICAGKQRQAGDSQGQNGILVLIDEVGQRQTIDIKVQTCKPTQSQVQKVLSVQSGERIVDNPLRYYVNRQSRHVVLSVYEKMRSERRAMRSSIEIIDVETWQSLLLLITNASRKR